MGERRNSRSDTRRAADPARVRRKRRPRRKRRARHNPLASWRLPSLRGAASPTPAKRFEVAAGFADARHQRKPKSASTLRVRPLSPARWHVSRHGPAVPPGPGGYFGCPLPHQGVPEGRRRCAACVIVAAPVAGGCSEAPCAPRFAAGRPSQRPDLCESSDATGTAGLLRSGGRAHGCREGTRMTHWPGPGGSMRRRAVPPAARTPRPHTEAHSAHAAAGS